MNPLNYNKTSKAKFKLLGAPKQVGVDRHLHNTQGVCRCASFLWSFTEKSLPKVHLQVPCYC